MDKKTRPIYMLPPRDSTQVERYTHIKSKGIEKRYFMQMEWKTSWGSNTSIQQNGL